MILDKIDYEENGLRKCLLAAANYYCEPNPE